MGIDFAEYKGRNLIDAKHYIDNSQGRKGFARCIPAHPRNHCSVSNPNNNIPCVENDSKGCRRYGFLSKADQDLVGHYVLSHARIQRELNVLNQYNKVNNNGGDYIRRSIDISANELHLPRRVMGGEWIDGELKSTFNLQTVTIVFQHFDGMETNPNAPVHILTFLPRKHKKNI